MDSLLDIAFYSAIGTRSNNEDCCAVRRTANGAILVVADGLGGHAQGEVASRLATDSVVSQLENAQFSEETLEEAIIAANAAICARQGDGNMMSTVAVLWVEGSQALAAHVGDSRIYQFRAGQICFQSRDHSEVRLAMDVGEIPESEIRLCAGRNRLIRALGGARRVRVEISERSLLPGDAFLLCSDGFWEPVYERDMLRLLGCSRTADEWLAGMRAIAEPAAADNNTAVAMILT